MINQFTWFKNFVKRTELCQHLEFPKTTKWRVYCELLVLKFNINNKRLSLIYKISPIHNQSYKYMQKMYNLIIYLYIDYSIKRGWNLNKLLKLN